MTNYLRPAATIFIALTLLCGIVYPYVVTGFGRLAWSGQAAGSIVTHDGKAIGSRLIGQAFTSPRYFWGRPSATAPVPNNASASGGSNQGPLNPALADAVKARIAALRAADPGNAAPVPVDLVTASASGLDPDISLAAAHYQAGRVARARGIAPARVTALIDQHAERPLSGFLGEPKVNVLALNMALDQLAPDAR
ncbi:potassium-transporting ATPase subunit KdpC [Pseudoduganella umbonata]|uniref:Potassium-transporting ATPase KdpC subunit n=1 Tax=Pseudoduganella umbonata TaxID=864828 RepID=A0A4P8HQ27_9BURK|nr:potassium-transporting ATPase subunit KdpC [Pseudoduganella umbonata]MBB3220659.1 K+-transporting ATPase ATPase C chain [Pseudoduganella umbonata]QCP11853.1 potassium-transporting ATPase subunit KdpC [Pseudoduganella umbonata]